MAGEAVDSVIGDALMKSIGQLHQQGHGMASIRCSRNSTRFSQAFFLPATVTRFGDPGKVHRVNLNPPHWDQSL